MAAMRRHETHPCGMLDRRDKTDQCACKMTGSEKPAAAKGNVKRTQLSLGLKPHPGCCPSNAARVIRTNVNKSHSVAEASTHPSAQLNRGVSGVFGKSRSTVNILPWGARSFHIFCPDILRSPTVAPNGTGRMALGCTNLSRRVQQRFDKHSTRWGLRATLHLSPSPSE
jgi:hypothetical protein